MAAVSPASAGGGRWEVVRRGRRPAGRPRDPPTAPGAPIATTETLFELGFERAPRRAAREAAAEPQQQQQQQQQQRRQQSGKGARKAAGDGGSRPGRFRSLEEALRAVSGAGGAAAVREGRPSRAAQHTNPAYQPSPSIGTALL